MKNNHFLLAEDRDEKLKAPNTDLITLLDQVADRFPDRDAIVSLHQTGTLNGIKSITGQGSQPLHLTFSQLRQTSIQLAARLSSKGVGHGSRLAALVFNQAEWAILFWASARLGCHFAPLDPRVLDRDGRDVLYLLEQLEPAAIFVSTKAMSNRIDQIMVDQAYGPSIQCILSGDDEEAAPAGWTTLSKLLSEPSNGLPVRNEPRRADDTVLVLLTSGTTALPKGCLHTSISIGAQGLGMRDNLDLAPGARLCQHLPTFHVFNIVLTLAFWLAGATVIFPSSSFNPQSSWQPIKSYRGIFVPCVPAMVQALSSCAPQGSSSLSFKIILGGAPVTLDVVKRSINIGATTVMPGYGLTEGVCFINTSIDTASLDLMKHDISVGKIISGGVVRICALGSRAPIQRGEVGEVHIGGLPVFGGYIGGGSGSFYQENGVNWLATGDQGYMDGDGYLYLLGRYKDLIIRGGENISPLRIEQCLGGVSGITAVSVLGIPDAMAGEVPVAVVRQDSTQALIKKTLQTKVLNELGPSFAPSRIIDLHDDLGKDHYPTTTSGKIQKTVLREWVIEHLNQVESSGSSTDLKSEVTTCWSTLTGLAPEDIDPDMPIRQFTDSMTQIQFCYLVNQRLHLVLAPNDLVELDTIGKQAEFLKKRKEHPSVDFTSRDNTHVLPMQLDIERTKRVASSKLDLLGLGWDDVEEAIPMTDLMKQVRYGLRPTASNVRMSWIAESSITVTELQVALHTWLARHPLLRSTPVTYDDDLDLYLVIKPSAEWAKLQVVHGDTVEDLDGVATYKLNDPEYDHVKENGPLFRATILNVRNPSVVGLVMHLHHLMFDAHTLFRWFEDLQDLLNRKTQLLHFHPYRDYAADYHRFRVGTAAQKATDFHADRIRGISSTTDALWPPQLVPHWFKGDDQGWVHSDNTPGRTSERPLLDGTKSRGTKGISRAVLVPRILELRQRLAIAPPIIAKCACALLNVRKTGAKEAVFGTIESGRTWPSADGSRFGAKGIDVLELDGPTMIHCLTRTTILPEETTLQLLTRMTKDQDDLVSHAYVPLDDVFRKLDASDATAFLDVVRRQSFNWIMQGYQQQTAHRIQRIDGIGRPDIGFSWLPGLSNGNLLRLNVTYDDAQFRANTIYNIMTEYLCAVAWLSEPDNMDKPVGQCEFKGYDIVDLDVEGPALYRR